MITGSAESVTGWFKWAHPGRDSAAATRELTTRFVVEIADFAVAITSVFTILKCLWLILQLWCDIDWIHKGWLIGLTTCTAAVIYLLWFFLSPFEGTLPDALINRAIDITEREGLADLDGRIQFVVVIIAIPLVAMTSGFIIAKDVAEARSQGELLSHLTTLLFLTAALVVLFMFMQGTILLWAASLLPQGKDSQGPLVEQLALAISINFGVFFALLLTAIHVPSVWAVTRKHCMDQLGNAQHKTPIQYYVRLATILSPILAGIPLTKLASFVFSL